MATVDATAYMTAVEDGWFRCPRLGLDPAFLLSYPYAPAEPPRLRKSYPFPPRDAPA